MGDAGAVTTCDDALAEVVRVFANYGSQQKYHFKYKGMNSRMSEIDAAILDVKLQYLETDNLKRKQLANLYWEGIKNPKIVLPQKIEETENVYHIFPVFCEERDALQQYLEAHGIQTLIHYPIPPHQQECYKEWAGRSYPISEQIHKTELSLPLNQAMTENEVQRVVDVLNAF